jgi:hypothetical protein
MVARGGLGSQHGAAGTVYLERAADGQRAGTVIVDNSGRSVGVDVATPVPACLDPGDDLSASQWTVWSNAILRLSRDVNLRSLNLTDATAKLELGSATASVRALQVNGTRYVDGEYGAADFPGQVSGSGRIVVRRSASGSLLSVW